MFKIERPSKLSRHSSILSKCFTIFFIALLVIYCFSLLLPIFWMLINSFKGYQDYLLHPFQFPQKWLFSNYTEVFDVLKAPFQTKEGDNVQYGLFPMAVYSIIYTFSFSFLNVLAFALVAYVIARYKFPGRQFLFSLGIVVMIVPIVGSLPSTMYIRQKLGIYNNMFLTIITSPASAFSGLYFLLFYAAFKNIPMSYSEAVFIDGGGHYTALFRVILPIVVPSCVAVFVLIFLGCWNDYNTFLLWLPSYPSLSIGLYLFEQGATTGGRVGMPVILAAFVVVMIPTCVLYLATQGILTSKFSVGGLKG